MGYPFRPGEAPTVVLSGETSADLAQRENFFDLVNFDSDGATFQLKPHARGAFREGERRLWFPLHRIQYVSWIPRPEPAPTGIGRPPETL